jgi:hypothetical protein
MDPRVTPPVIARSRHCDEPSLRGAPPKAGRRSNLPPEPVDPVARYVPLLLRLSLYAFLTWFLIEAIPIFYSYDPNEQWPRLIWIFRTFTFLPLHEGGHLLFILFGRTLYALGGSFWQITFPLLWFAIALKQKSQVAPFPLFWTGENMMDVSLYIRDSQDMVLPLLGGHKSGHDWHFLLTKWDFIDSCQEIADVMFFAGVIVSIVAIIGGIAWAGVAYYESAKPVAPKIIN